jgi:hypothetical protein
MHTMIGTFQALLEAMVAVLPGALYTIAREHRNAAWVRGDLTSRLIGFLGVSAVFQALYAPLTYWIYVHAVVHRPACRREAHGVVLVAGLTSLSLRGYPLHPGCSDGEYP